MHNPPTEKGISNHERKIKPTIIRSVGVIAMEKTKAGNGDRNYQGVCHFK